jgi:hypothetical protein
MSGAMAYYCDVFATLMSDKDKDKDNVPKDGIWYTVEFDRLKRTDNAGKVDKVELIKPNGSGATKYWERPNDQKRGENYTSLHEFPSLTQRDGSKCGAPKGVETVFDKGGKLPVDW